MAYQTPHSSDKSEFIPLFQKEGSLKSIIGIYETKTIHSKNWWKCHRKRN